MPLVYRLVRKKHARPAELLSGAGASLVGGRWNERGTRLVYASSHVSLTALEALVHASALPNNLVLIEVDIPDDAVLGRWRSETLPGEWADYPFKAAAQELGTAWARTGKQLGLWVPSAVVPTEWNCLINPMHADIARVKAKVLGPFRFDPRLGT